MVVIEKVFSKDQVSAYRQQLATCPWGDGRKTAMGMAASVKNNNQADAQDPKVRQLANQLLARIGDTPKLFQRHYHTKFFRHVLTVIAKQKNMAITSMPQ